MSIAAHAMRTPDKPATIMAGSGAVVTYAQLDDSSRRLANVLHDGGLRAGDVVALFMENNPRYHDVYWAAVRSGLYVCPVNKYLTVDEVSYIVEDSGATALITSSALGDVAAGVAARTSLPIRLSVDGRVDGFDPYEEAIGAASADALGDESAGDFMNYSSGTTGRPKGIKRPLSGKHFSEPTGLQALLRGNFGMGADSRYLSPAPLYHSAPMAFTTTIHALGGTNIIMERFAAVDALRWIETYEVTHSQWVPTMFVRMLKLDDDVRTSFDLSSQRTVIHAAAPCPLEVKRQMIDWLGPIIWEYYGGTELNGLTMCNSEEWLAHPGTVGRPVMGELHICGNGGEEMPTGEQGTIYFARDSMPFEYHNAPDKTEGAKHPEHPLWTKLGDVGYVDEDGYLYLTDRESFMIIAGGVNIYPQEIEDCLIMHPKVADVAVVGVPNADLGEEVKAIVQPAEGVHADDALAAEILSYAAGRLARYKVPRSVDFESQLPRLETGKLYKRLLRDRYWGEESSRIV